LGNTGGCVEGYGVAAEFEGVDSEAGDGELVVSDKVGNSSGAG